jgi:type I restriction enzyme S subunit
MSGWPIVALGDCVDMTVGFPFKSQGFRDQSIDAIRLLRGDNVAQGSLRWEGAKHWPADDVAQHEAYALRERDVIWRWIARGSKRG